MMTIKTGNVISDFNHEIDRKKQKILTELVAYNSTHNGAKSFFELQNEWRYFTRILTALFEHFFQGDYLNADEFNIEFCFDENKKNHELIITTPEKTIAFVGRKYPIKAFQKVEKYMQLNKNITK